MNVIVDLVGANYFTSNLAAVAVDGRIAHLGALGGFKLPADATLAQFIPKRVRFQGSSLRGRDLEYQRLLRDRLEREVLPAMREGKLRGFVEKVFDWGEVADAHRLMEGNGVKGKIICRVV